MTHGVAVAKSLSLCLSVTRLKELWENSVLLCFKNINGLISIRCLRILFGFSLWGLVFGPAAPSSQAETKSTEHYFCVCSYNSVRIEPIIVINAI